MDKNMSELLISVNPQTQESQIVSVGINKKQIHPLHTTHCTKTSEHQRCRGLQRKNREKIDYYKGIKNYRVISTFNGIYKKKEKME